jgi:hypothetical protein
MIIRGSNFGVGFVAMPRFIGEYAGYVNGIRLANDHGLASRTISRAGLPYSLDRAV